MTEEAAARIMWFTIVVGVMSINGVIGYAIGRNSSQPVGSFLMGAFMGPIGWLLILIAGNSGARKCQDCKGVVDADARKCRHCGSVLESPR